MSDHSRLPPDAVQYSLPWSSCGGPTVDDPNLSFETFMLQCLLRGADRRRDQHNSEQGRVSQEDRLQSPRPEVIQLCPMQMAWHDVACYSWMTGTPSAMHLPPGSHCFTWSRKLSQAWRRQSEMFMLSTSRRRRKSED